MDTFLDRIQEQGIDLSVLSHSQSLVLWYHILEHMAESNEEKAYALFMCSEYEVKADLTEKSICHLQRALTLLVLPTHIDLILQIYSSLSYRHIDFGNYQNALSTLDNLSKIAVEHGKSEFYIQSILGIGNLCSIYGDHLKALRYYQKLESLSHIIESHNLALRYRLYMIACLLDLNRLSKANKLLKECLVIQYLVDDPQLAPQVALYSAKLLRLKNKPQLALDQLISFKKECKYAKISFPWLNKLFAIEAANCLIQLQRGEMAEVIINHQIRRTSKYSNGYYIRQLLDIKSNALASYGNFSDALTCEKKAQKLAVDIIHSFPINKLGGHALRRLFHLELQLRLSISESENIELKKVSVQQKNKVKKLQKDVQHDSLTKLYNRRWFESAFIKKILPTIKHYQLLIIDIDDFKSINDEYSHLTGDVVLKRLGRILQKNLDNSHYALRYGGEEFLLIIPSNDLEVGRRIAEQCRELIANVSWKHILNDRSITVSIGLAINTNSEPCKSTFLRADKALYKAKRSGKNKVCIY
ncbi:GGDEF domain-containing protein [Aliivibrio salmonicida]|uniref:diguanylate cyclase n=1 Tax=Aliivibrio salmonicida (strain LFI1238) TaxID=316275 RepID=B6ER76_ALISL|nr:GGDEF domain-containing protein [Aliivibrio salmonicida]AZL86594.1 GGDEF domain-containing protein [Aliivibrio salmonicida]CAQ81206.1 putative GGDEF protein [Aliivibrio salmonicida LFI1238]